MREIPMIRCSPEAPGGSLSLEIRQITMIAVDGILDSVQLNLAEILWGSLCGLSEIVARVS